MQDLIRFWGVRGSIASPGPHTAGVGGNTACVEVRLGGQRIILDGGTGLRQLGMAQEGRPLQAWLLFGHLHWDHIQGVPFLSSLFQPESEVRILGPQGLREALASQMSGPPTFPLTLDFLSARLSFQCLSPGEALPLGSVELRTARLNHPGGGLAYRLTHGRDVVVYACDTEHPAQGLDEALLDLARGADTLIYDAQYLPAEYPGRRGWGHSTYAAGAELAAAAGVRRLLLTHHDPARDDMAVARIEREARALFPEVRAAREGDMFPLGCWAEDLAADSGLATG